MLQLLFLLMLLFLFVFFQVPRQGIAVSFCVSPGSYSDIQSLPFAYVSEDYITLVNSSRGERYGRVLYKSPVRLLDPSGRVVSFQTDFVFKIEMNGNLSADGMTFLFAPTKDAPSANTTGGYLGFNAAGTDGNEKNHLFGVEFDSTYDDTDQSHVGVNINGVNSKLVHPLDDSPNSAVSLRQNLILKSRIDYRGETEELRVWLDKNNSGEFGKPKFMYTVNLTTVLLQEMFVGFSAATGSDTHRSLVYSWRFNSTDPAPASADPKRRNPKLARSNLAAGILVVKVLVPAILAVLGGFLLCYWFCLRNEKAASAHVTRLTSFTHKELHSATKGFSSKELIGEGGSCKVYRGFLPTEGSYVAVKLLARAVGAEAQFLSELSVISAVRHHNLVAFRGWCQEKNRLLLVYEFMSNGSLDHFIFSKDPRMFLSWKQRYEIMKGVAEGLAYLHEGLDRRIVHRDVKAANVLLDEKFTAKLGDFGLAKLMEQTKGAQTMTKVGTLGYIAPEVAYSGRATEKSDVYSFGVLVLEIVAGRRGLDYSLAADTEDEQEDAAVVLLDWVWSLYEADQVDRAVDRRFFQEDEFDQEQAVLCLRTGLVCCLPDAQSRPSMRRCCQFFNGDIEAMTLPQYRPRYVSIDLFPCETDSSAAASTSSRLFKSESSAPSN